MPYCSMIHGGLHLVLKAGQSTTLVQHCCLRDNHWPVDRSTDLWNDSRFQPLRQKQEWDPGCANCQSLEQSGAHSLRTGMNDGLQIYPATNLSGPARIDLTFDTSCNLACRTCGPRFSTFWQQYLQQPIRVEPNKNAVIDLLSQLDLTNLRMLVFCGGETLLGQQYWDVAEWLALNVPNTKQQLTLCFQTNGTQAIHARNYELIEKFFLVKLHVSLDGVGTRFEYLRWPASWNQVTDNLSQLRQSVPSNVMFLIEETVSIFNLAYLHELDSWAKQNFSINREGDPVNHTRHLATGTFNLQNCSHEYVDWTRDKISHAFIAKYWQESPSRIIAMLEEINKHDYQRQQSFSKVFPEVAGFYQRFM